jgi:hypothetical protein
MQAAAPQLSFSTNHSEFSRSTSSQQTNHPTVFMKPANCPPQGSRCTGQPHRAPASPHSPMRAVETGKAFDAKRQHRPSSPPGTAISVQAQ